MQQKSICLLDLGGVVFQASGKSNDMINWDVITILNGIYGHELNLGKDIFLDFVEDYNDRTNLQLTGDQFLTHLWKTLDINQGLIDLIQKHYSIVIVSDNYRENIYYISEKFNFKSWAMDEIYSFDYRLEKANPEFFQRLLREKEWHPRDLLFIDDSQSKLDSAAQSGIKGILYRDNEDIAEILGVC